LNKVIIKLLLFKKFKCIDKFMGLILQKMFLLKNLTV